MKKSIVAGLVVAALSSGAQAYMVDDTYVGGKDWGYGDVIGQKNMFDVVGLNASISGTVLTVDIFTSFYGSDVGSYKELTKNGKGIGYGDLFLSSAWTPYGSAANGYKYDNNVNGTKWTYGFSVNDNWSKTGGNGKLYALNGATNDANAKLSQDYMKSGYYRTGQEVTVDRQSSTVQALTNGSWAVSVVDPTGYNGTVLSKITMVMDLAFTDLLNGDKLAFHWGELCGNDVIEGEISIPKVDEPATLALFGLGLAGLMASRRRKA